MNSNDPLLIVNIPAVRWKIRAHIEHTHEGIAYTRENYVIVYECLVLSKYVHVALYLSVILI